LETNFAAVYLAGEEATENKKKANLSIDSKVFIFNNSNTLVI